MTVHDLSEKHFKSSATSDEELKISRRPSACAINLVNPAAAALVATLASRHYAE